MTRTLALITGASSGIGVAYARLLAPDHDFVLVARRADRLQLLAEELRVVGAAVEVLPSDMSKSDGVGAVVDRLAAGDIRMLINNAGAGGFARLEDVTPEDITGTLTLNSTAPISLTHASLPGMRAAGSGTIINVASLLALSGGVDNPQMPARTLYAAAKAALATFTRVLSVELASTGIRTQLVYPGVVATEFDNGSGRDLPFAMKPGDVAAASLTGLFLGETICIPAHDDLEATLDALLTAETALLTGGNRASLATRYAREGNAGSTKK